MIMLYRTIYFIFIGTIFGTLFIACSEDDSAAINNEELIFSNSYPIKISAYNYSDSLGTVYYVRGDTNYPIPPDTLNNQPTLAWDSISLELVSAAILTSPVRVSGGEITNITDIVWQWHSGMEFETINRIKYSEGRNLINGVIINRNPATPLSKGHYYWAAWGWSNSGIRVLYSSRQREFYVSE